LSSLLASYGGTDFCLFLQAKCYISYIIATANTDVQDVEQLYIVRVQVIVEVLPKVEAPPN